MASSLQLRGLRWGLAGVGVAVTAVFTICEATGNSLGQYVPLETIMWASELAGWLFFVGDSKIPVPSYTCGDSHLEQHGTALWMVFGIRSRLSILADQVSSGHGECVEIAIGGNAMRFLRTVLLCLSFVAVFIAAGSWLYLLIGFGLWIFVFGDNSSTFGLYALAIAIPLALLLSAVFAGAAERWSAGPIVLTGVILVAAIFEVIFLIAISS